MTMTAVDKGTEFENQVAEIYRLMGYETKQNVGIMGHQIDIILLYTMPDGTVTRTAVECKYIEKGNLRKNDVMSNINNLVDIARNNEVENLIVVTTNGFAKDVWDTAKNNNIQLLTVGQLLSQTVNFDSYINRIIYDFENWHEYSEDHRKPIIELFYKADLYNHYVHLRCRDSQYQVYDPIDRYIENWLKNNDKNHITLLGDYGTGKSSFLLYLTYILAKSYKNDPSALPIPIFISLKNYAEIKDIKKTIIETLENDYDVTVYSPAYFQKLLEEGKLILLLDGFDEMESKSKRDMIVNNFEEINKLVTKNSKVILTSRTHYFKTHSHVKNIFNPQYDDELWKIVRNNHRFEIVELLEFNNEQIIDFLQRHTNDYMEMWRKIKSTYNLEDLSKRPILLEMIIKSLPRLMKAGKEINSSELYKAYTDVWVDRDDWRSNMSISEKSVFMEELAYHMFSNNIQSVPYTDLNELVVDHFQRKIVSSEDADFFDTDTRTCSFLNRDQSGNYKFIHKSFMEYFVAKKFFKEIEDNKVKFFKNMPLVPEIIDFLSKMNLDKNKLYETIYFTTNRKFEEVGYMGGNAISILAHMGETLTNTNFSNTILRNAILDGTICDNSDFSNTELQSSSFIDSSLLYANFEAANLDGALIEGIGHVSSISLDQNNENIAFGTINGHVYVVNLHNFNKTYSIKDTSFSIEKIRFFGEDKYLGFIDSNSQIYIYSLESFGQCLMKQNVPIDSDFNPYLEEFVLLCPHDKIKIINVKSKEEKLIDLIYSGETFSKIHYLDDFNLILIDSKNNIRILNLETEVLSNIIQSKLNNIDLIDYRYEENLLYLRQNNRISESNEKHAFLFDYEIVNLEKKESETLNGVKTGAISKLYNLIMSVELYKYDVKFRIMDLNPHKFFIDWNGDFKKTSDSLLQFLKDKFNLDISNVKIKKSEDGKLISISKFEKLTEIIIDDEEKITNVKTRGFSRPIKTKLENGKLTIYGKNMDLSSVDTSHEDFCEIFTINNFEHFSEDEESENIDDFLSYLLLNETAGIKIHISHNKMIEICKEYLVELRLDKANEIAILQIGDIVYDFKVKIENDSILLYDRILKESYNNSLNLLDSGIYNPTFIKTNFLNYIPPIAFSKDSKSIYIADYSGNLLLWNWSKEPPLQEKEHINWDGKPYGSKTMLKSRYINQNLFKCDYMNLCKVSGIREGQLQELKKMGAIVECQE